MKPDSIASCAALLALLSTPVWAADAGRVLVAAGDAIAVRGQEVVKLALGAPVRDGDVLRTGAASSLQVRFADESLLSLRENSEIRIEAFRFAGKEDGSERAFFRLLKGGLRKVTGIIGRTNHRNYAMQTRNGVIGVRGTDYAAALCQQDCRNPDGTLAKDGLYGRVIGSSFGTNRNAVTNDTGEHLFGIGQNYYVADAGSAPQLLLEPPAFVNAAASARSGRPPAGTGEEQPAAGGAGQDPRGTTSIPPPPDPAVFVGTEQQTASGAPAVLAAGPTVEEVVAGPTVAGVGTHFDALGRFDETGDGGGFFTPANLTTDPAGAAADLSIPQKLIGFTLPAGFSAEVSNPFASVGETSARDVIDETVRPNALNAHWGRWLSGTITELDETPNPNVFSQTSQFHYLYGPLTPPDVVAAKSGSFAMTLVGGTTPTNHLGESGTFGISSLAVDFTGRTVAFGAIRLGFPSDTFSFEPGSAPIQFSAGNGAFVRHTTSGICSGETCFTSTPAVLGATGVFMGPAGNHLGIGFGARTTSGSAAHANTVQLFTCAPSC